MGFYWILLVSLAQLHYPSSLGFMGLLSTLYFHYFRSVVTHSHFFISYTAHGLLFLSFRTALSSFTSSRPICLSHRSVIHYSCRLGLMSFLFICQLFYVHVIGFLLSTWTSKIAINTNIMVRVWHYYQRRNSSFYTNLSSQVTIHHQSWTKATKMNWSVSKWTKVDQNRLNEWN